MGRQGQGAVTRGGSAAGKKSHLQDKSPMEKANQGWSFGKRGIGLRKPAGDLASWTRTGTWVVEQRPTKADRETWPVFHWAGGNFQASFEADNQACFPLASSSHCQGDALARTIVQDNRRHFDFTETLRHRADSV